MLSAKYSHLVLRWPTLCSHVFLTVHSDRETIPSKRVRKLKRKQRRPELKSQLCQLPRATTEKKKKKTYSNLTVFFLNSTAYVCLSTSLRLRLGMCVDLNSTLLECFDWSCASCTALCPIKWVVLNSACCCLHIRTYTHTYIHMFGHMCTVHIFYFILRFQININAVMGC